MSENNKDDGISYEVLTEQGGRWELHARYPLSKKATAIADAESLEGISTITSVKVVRDEYDPEKGESVETIVYPKPKAPPEPVKASKPAKAAKKKKAKPKAAAKPAKEQKPKEPRKRTSRAGIFLKLILATVISIAAGALVTGIAIPFLRDLPISNQARTIALFGTFIAVFLGCAISMITSIMSRARLDTPRRRRAEALAVQAPQSIPGAGDSLRTGGRDDQLSAAAVASMNFDSAIEKGVKLKRGSYKVEKPKKSKPLAPKAKKQKETITTFLNEAFEEAGMAPEKLDKFNKFGVSLYLAGSMEGLGEDEQVDLRSSSQVLSECLQSIGYGRAEADKFADRYESYLMEDSRYMQMFQAGRNAIGVHVNDEESAGGRFKSAMGEWNSGKDKEDKSGTVTVLFTDMVGSTSLTQTKGDEVAQKVVRAHNRFVRDALKNFDGKEIKHTGDGIMASFSNTSNSVKASIAIQNDTEAHNKSNPDLPLKIKIGINAGEPIAEDDDLFGTTVQLAARIVDKAQADQIFVSQAVFGICAGKDINFTSRGGYAMKGFDDDQVLYEVIWRTGLAELAATAEPEPELEPVPEPESVPEPEPEGLESESEPEPEPVQATEQPAPEQAEAGVEPEAEAVAKPPTPAEAANGDEKPDSQAS